MRTTVSLLGILLLATGCTAQTTAPALADWHHQEAMTLQNHVQLTFADQFVRAGEAYFSPDNSQVIFQAVAVPPPDQEAAEFYSMYVGDVQRDKAGRISGLRNITQVSPVGSANTCGWFHPTEPGTVIFGSTVTPPVAQDSPGYQRASGRYRWAFPPEMDIVQVRLSDVGKSNALTSLVSNRSSYLAECSISPDARHLLYCSLESNEGDLLVKDFQTGKISNIVQNAGYDGGPFFSPDGRRICYRSDRHGDHLLQVFVADLAFNAEGSIIGIEREFQLTDDENVNWCPFWHPNGRFLVFSTSRIGHHNYEVFILDADSGNQAGSTGSVKYGTRIRRVTFADTADVLPAFSHDGKTMIWTSKRGPNTTSQLWVADFVADLDARPTTPTSGPGPGH